MKLRQNTKDPFLLEDELCNPMFRFVGNHTSDIKEFLTQVSYLEEKVQTLGNEVEDLRDKLKNVRDIIL